MERNQKVTSPQLAIATKYGRLYHAPNIDPETLPTVPKALDEGLLVPSVTNVIGLLDKPYLNGWYAKLAAQEAINITFKYPDLIKQKPTAAAEYIKSAAERYTEASAQLGDKVHNAVEALALEEEPPEVNPTEQLYVNAWHQFVKDFQPKFLRLEATCYGTVTSPRGPLGYAGTADFIAIINGQTILGDNKTGKSVHTEAALQINALANSHSIVSLDGTKMEPMPKIDGGAVLHLTKTGYKLHPVPLTAKAEQAFIDARTLWRFHQDNLVSRKPLGINQPVHELNKFTLPTRERA